MKPPPVYAIVDRRQDGRARIVYECREPDEALAAAQLLEAAGDRTIEVVPLVVRDDEGAR